MPELPEVESTVRYLQERIEGRTIIDAFVNWHRTIATHSPQSFKSSVISSEIRRVFRRGKFIGMELCGKKSLFLFIHLRMSGSLDVIATKNPHATHDRAVLNLNNNKSVRFNDTRKFGRIYLCDDPDVVVGGLGIEPLSEKFTPLFLHSLLKKRAARIKPLLLNQNIIAGLGNIYVDEALWRAKIHPRAEARKVSMRRCELLHHAITETLSEAIGLLGTDFGDGVVHGGMYVPKVYGREGEECATCGALIRKTIVGQRGTHFCPNCQALRS